MSDGLASVKIWQMSWWTDQRELSGNSILFCQLLSLPPPGVLLVSLQLKANLQATPFHVLSDFLSLDKAAVCLVSFLSSLYLSFSP